MKEETKSTIKLFAALLIVIFVFKALSPNPEYVADAEDTITEETSIDIEETKEPEEEIDELEKVDDLAEYRPKKVELSAGYHKIGIPTGGSINSGTYRVYAKSGFGLITGDLWQGYISETVGYNHATCVTESINKLFLTSGDSFKIEGRCELVFEPIE